MGQELEIDLALWCRLQAVSRCCNPGVGSGSSHLTTPLVLDCQLPSSLMQPWASGPYWLQAGNIRSSPHGYWLFPKLGMGAWRVGREMSQDKSKSRLHSEEENYIRSWAPRGRDHWGPSYRLPTTIFKFENYYYGSVRNTLQLRSHFKNGSQHLSLLIFSPYFHLTTTPWGFERTMRKSEEIGKKKRAKMTILGEQQNVKI